MKYPFITIYITSLLSLNLSAQTLAVKRFGFSRSIGKDSLDISFRHDYFLVEDSCADIIRLCGYNNQERKFKGRFKDVNKSNAEQLIATGSYDVNGLKEGDFISYYLNGNLEAKGNFKRNMYNGKWEFFYPTGKPKINFVANGTEVKILNTWDEQGKKIVDNGYGDYESIIGGTLIWRGKLVGGTPDGKWILHKMHRSEDILVTEWFKLGEFQKGKNQVGEYTDASRIVLVSTDLLSLVKAENLRASSEPCDVARKKYIIPARYPKGAEQFGEEIKERLAPVLNKLNLTSFNEPLELQGKIWEDGRLTFTAKNGDPGVTSTLISGLYGLPSLEPARADGKKVQQDMIITIKYNSSVYSFSYRFLPIKAD
jgi:hypothetical protein